MTRTQTLLPVAFLAAAVLAAGGMASALHTSEHYSLFGDSSIVSPGNSSNRAVEASSIGAGAGGVSYGVEDGVAFADITELSTDYLFTTGSCAGGSPRFSIGLDSTGDGVTDGYAFAYIGPSPNYTGCATGTWETSGDLLESGMTLDTAQLGGTFYDPYDNAIAQYGSYEVTEIFLVMDGGWSADQVARFDNTQIGTMLFTYELPVATHMDQCKNGGWQNVTDAEGNPFRNQGQCVSSTVPPARAGGPGPAPL